MIKKDDYTIYYIWLSEAVCRSYKAYRELMSVFDNVYDVYRAEPEEYMRLSRHTKKYIEGLCDKSIGNAVKISDFCRKNAIHILTYESTDYPSLLKNIEAPPLVLYVRGKQIDFDSSLCIAGVGTRKMTEYGKEVSYNFGYSLAKNKAVLVSGMALGCDSVSMCAAIDAGGLTVGVLGSGVDIAYPPEHAHFMSYVEKHGALISEYPPGTKAEPSHFPERNRIISGLCRALIVFEGDSKSGAMISARHASSQGRAVYAVPGRLDEKSSEGAVSLLLDGARIAREANDILREYALLYRGKIDLKSYEKLTGTEIDKRLSVRGVRDKCIKAKIPEIQAKKAKSAVTEIKAQENGAFASLIKLKDKKAKQGNQDNKEKTNNTSPNAAMLSDELRLIYEKLPKDEMFLADDVVKYKISAQDFLSSVTMLEIYGLAVSYPGGRYVIK